MTEQELIEKIDTVLADEFEVDRTTITPEAPLLETLDLDSLDLVDVVVIVDKNFGVTLTGPDFKEPEDLPGLLRPDYQPDEWEITANSGADARAAAVSGTISSSC